MTFSNVSADWQDHFETCKKHNEKFHASEWCCFCEQTKEALESCGPCPECGEDDADVHGVKGAWYLHCNDCGHNSGEEFFMEDLGVDEWPTDK
jgi:hypothetical protein